MAAGTGPAAFFITEMSIKQAIPTDMNILKKIIGGATLSYADIPCLRAGNTVTTVCRHVTY